MNPNTEKILLVAKGLQTIDDAKVAKFTCFFLGVLAGHSVQYPGPATDALCNCVAGCGAMFGIHTSPEVVKKWLDELSSAPAEESKTPDAGASDTNSERK
jgi:hypothetical protein